MVRNAFIEQTNKLKRDIGGCGGRVELTDTTVKAVLTTPAPMVA